MILNDICKLSVVCYIDNRYTLFDDVLLHCIMCISTVDMVIIVIIEKLQIVVVIK